MAAVEPSLPDHPDIALHPLHSKQLGVKSQDQFLEAEKRILLQLESDSTGERLRDLNFYCSV